jgi:hypothetical protein
VQLNSFRYDCPFVVSCITLKLRQITTSLLNMDMLERIVDEIYEASIEQEKAAADRDWRM